MEISQRYDDLTNIPVNDKSQCLRGRWNNWLRILIIKVDARYLVISANMIERFVYALLKIVQIDYFKLKLGGKEVKVLDPSELNATDKKISSLNPARVITPDQPPVVASSPATLPKTPLTPPVQSQTLPLTPAIPVAQPKAALAPTPPATLLIPHAQLEALPLTPEIPVAQQKEPPAPTPPETPLIQTVQFQSPPIPAQPVSCQQAPAIPVTPIDFKAVLNRTFTEWNKVLLGPYDARFIELTRDLNHALTNCTDDIESKKIVQEMIDAYDQTLALVRDLGIWIYQDAGSHGTDSANSAYNAFVALTHTMHKKNGVVSDFLARAQHTGGLEANGFEELKNILFKIKHTEDFSQPLSFPTVWFKGTRGYELGKGGVLYQIKPSGSFEEANPEKFRKCNFPNEIDLKQVSVQALERKFTLCFVLPCAVDLIDVVLNERYLCFYTKGDKEENLVKLDWKSCFKMTQEPSFTDMKTYLTKAKVNFNRGVFAFNLQAESS